jgi:hypothetical protein
MKHGIEKDKRKNLEQVRQNFYRLWGKISKFVNMGPGQYNWYCLMMLSFLFLSFFFFFFVLSSPCKRSMGCTVKCEVCIEHYPTIKLEKCCVISHQYAKLQFL